MALSQPLATADEGRLGVLTLPASGAWGTEARSAALARVQAMGLPGRRDEYWKYTNPTLFNDASTPQTRQQDIDEPAMFGDVDRLRIVFVDGIFDADQSDDLALEGVEICRLSDAMSADVHWAKRVYGALETAGQSPVQRPHAALNSAFATDGIVVRVFGQPVKPICVSNLRASEQGEGMLHHVFQVEKGAKVTFLEHGPGSARSNECLEVDIADGAEFHHVRTQGRHQDRATATHLFARLAEKSVFKSFTATVNGTMIRNEAVIELTGDNAVAHIAGAALGDREFHHDDTVFVTHDAQDCESRQVFKKVLRNGATGVFQGKILVQPDAQRTDGYQISQSLLLDDDSQFLAKPELEIYADDVQCSHGSTSGAIDETGMFYLRSRGIPVDEATDLLVLAFLAEVVDEIEDPVIAEDITERLRGWLLRHRS